MPDSNRIQDFLNRQTTRRDFLKVAAKGTATLAVGATLLSLIGCSSDPVEQLGNRTGLPLSQGMLVADPALCSGCGRCELTCSLTLQKAAWPHMSAVKIDRGYQFGAGGPKLNYRYGGGVLGAATLAPETCRQCRSPFCANACPKQAILPDDDTGARLVNAELCDGCGLCVTACPWGMMTVDHIASKCTTCGACVAACPTGALSIQPWADL